MFPLGDVQTAIETAFNILGQRDFQAKG